MIIYRPHRGTLADSMADAKEFPTLKKLFEHLVSEHNNIFDMEDISVSYYGYDERIEWETFIVTTKRYLIYSPVVLGFLTSKRK